MVNRDPVKRAISERRCWEKNKAKIQARQRAHWATPEKKAQRKAYLARPEVKARMREYVKKYRATEKGRASMKKVARRHFLKKFYGLSPAEYAALVVTQNGKCAICGGANSDGRPLFVDHNHATNKVRELLCHWCNSVIGHCRENPIVLERAAAYLRKHLTVL